MTKHKRKQQLEQPPRGRCEHVYEYEMSTPKGDIYVCTECGKRINEKELNDGK